jgi:hypothetical protein
MRYILIILAFVALGCNESKYNKQLAECVKSTTMVIQEADSLYARDSALIVKQFELLTRQNSIITNLNDSIEFYRNYYLITKNKQLLSSANFIKIFKYDRLNKYYLICKRNPSQWKYYKGWSTRVFEH